MKKVKRVIKDELRSEYKPSDFLSPMVRGKYAKRLKESSNVVVLRPEVAAVFQSEEAVNNALLSLIKLAQTYMRPTKRSSGRATVRR
jgi:translation elongation factor EF-Ts